MEHSDFPWSDRGLLLDAPLGVRAFAGGVWALASTVVAFCLAVVACCLAVVLILLVYRLVWWLMS
jgi:hypothetical protein